MKANQGKPWPTDRVQIVCSRPEHFNYFHPNADDATGRSTEYAGAGWREEFSSAGPALTPGSERYTLDKTGTETMAATGASTMDCGAKKLRGLAAR